MLRILSSLQKLNNKSQPFGSYNSFRKYNYQTEIYTGKFKLDHSLNETLKSEINSQIHLKNEQPNLYRYIKAYHQYGHIHGQINPLEQVEQSNTLESKLFELNPEYYGLKNDSTLYSTQGLLFGASNNSMTLNEIEKYLQSVYSSNMTIEFDFISSEEEKHWLAKEFEAIQNQALDKKIKIDLLKLLLKSQV
jgi:2-oxoglutarate dehydrogenase complex dehydrogenase (E1) component-like enzyme